MPTTDAFGQGIQIASLTDPPNAATLAQNLAAMVPQTVMRFASASARTAAITSPVAGMVAFLTAEKILTVYDGTAWATVAVTTPSFSAVQTATQSIPTGVWTAVTFDTEDRDTHSGHSTVTNTSRYTIPVSGWYQVSGRVAFNNSSTSGSRGARIHKNGNIVTGAATIVGASTLPTVPQVDRKMALVAGDYIEIVAGQNSGSSISTINAFESASTFEVTYLSP
jgi:hypothetical protein